MDEEKILEEIKNSKKDTTIARNSMGCSENYYSKHFMVGECFTEDELNKMNKEELENLLRLAKFAGEVFY